MALLTPHDLTLEWDVDPGLGVTTSGTHHWLASGWTALVGERDVAGADEVRVVLVEFDPDTGEPLSFTSHNVVSSPQSGNQYVTSAAFPTDATTGYVVVVGRDSSRWWAKRVAYDLSGPTLTGGTLTTWAVSVSTASAAIPDNATVHLLANNSTALSTITLDVSAGTAGTQSNYTPSTVSGGVYDRFGNPVSGTSSGGEFAAAAPVGWVGIHCFNNASGAATGEYFFAIHTSTLSSATATGIGPGILTDAANMETSALILDSSPLTARRLDASGFTTVTTPEVFTDSTVQFIGSYPFLTGIQSDDQIIVENREGNGSATDDHVLRLIRPFADTEQGAWRFPGVFSDYTSVGVLSSDYRFFYHYQGTTSFEVYEDPDWPFPSGQARWWAGVAGSG